MELILPLLKVNQGHSTHFDTDILDSVYLGVIFFNKKHHAKYYC